MKTGFTLIELLVVVLIIGILAAIALPQYTRAVERARVAEAVEFLDNVAKAQNILYMQTGQFANSLSDLNQRGDITVQEPSDAWELWPFSTPSNEHGTGKGVMLQRSNGMFVNGALSIEVYPDGAVRKGCSFGDTGFCNMTESFGYRN